MNSSQARGVGKNPLLPCTTKRRITSNLKSINNQKCQKIKLHGTAPTKELKKQSTRPTRPVRQVDRENLWQGRPNVWAGPAERNHCEVADCVGRAGWKGNWDSELTVDCLRCCYGGRNSQSHITLVGKCPRAEQGSCIAPSQAPPPQAAPQRSKEGCLAPMNT